MEQMILQIDLVSPYDKPALHSYKRAFSICKGFVAGEKSEKIGVVGEIRATMIMPSHLSDSFGKIIHSGANWISDPCADGKAE